MARSNLYATLLTNPSSGAVEDTAPRTDVTPLFSLGRQVAGNATQNSTLGVRHDSQDTTVSVADTRNTLGTAVGVGRVLHGRLEGSSVDILDDSTAIVDERLRGGAGSGSERGATLTVGDGDGERGAVHAVQEDTGAGRIGVGDADHADTTFVLFAGVPLEAGPVLSARDQILKTRKELATVADTKSKSVRTLEEGLEFVAGVLMQQDGLGPTLTGTENITVRETTTGGETNEASEGYTAGDDVGHVNVNGREASIAESERHLCLTVDTLLTENGNTGLVAEG